MQETNKEAIGRRGKHKMNLCDTAINNNKKRKVSIIYRKQEVDSNKNSNLDRKKMKRK
jgi:hypothetical protein